MEAFGNTAEGEAAKLYIFTNSRNTEMAVSDYGATLVRVMVQDQNGDPCDVVLGYDDAAGYENGGYFFGAVVGRNANRIGTASFAINGTQYQLTENDNGNNLHSGPDFYSKRMWQVEDTTENSVTLSLFSPDGDQGYPGNVTVGVTYTLTEENEVQIEYRGIPDADTILNMTNHSYFNLNGHASGTILAQEIMIDAEAFTNADQESIPTGEIVSVAGTPMDFNAAKAVGRDIEADFEALKLGCGYDHNWVLGNEGKYARVAQMTSESTGIKMDVCTDLPGIQLYTGNFITDERGKNDVHYRRRQGLCFETQYFPDAIHKSNFASPVCGAGETYYTKTSYRFYL